MQFAKEVFEQKALEEAKALLEEKGFQISDKSSKYITGAFNRSRDDISVTGSKKKREVKATDKDGIRSEVSGKTNKSMRNKSSGCPHCQ
jgi:hypothetical protein